MRPVKTYAIKKRLNKVRIKDFAVPGRKGMTFRQFWQGLPAIGAGKDLRLLAERIVAAKKRKKPVVFLVGAHVIKCGLNPVIIDLIRRGIVDLIALNGAGAIHDFEIALIGGTSEDVEKNLADGSFGMAEETGSRLNRAINEGVGKGCGLGTAVGEAILEERLPHRHLSVSAAAVKMGIPVTVHVGIGTDIIHQHPDCDGAKLGEGSLRDFHILKETLMGLGGGGVVINFGSAVILPEVFLKALNLARNQGGKIKDFTCANLDMIAHYRPGENVVRRPAAALGGVGITVIGRHEIMIPLLAQAVIELLPREGIRERSEKTL